MAALTPQSDKAPSPVWVSPQDAWGTMAPTPENAHKAALSYAAQQPSVWSEPEQPMSTGTVAPVAMPTPPKIDLHANLPQVFAPTTPGDQQISHDQAALQKVRWNQTHPWGTNPTFDANGTMTDPGNHPGKLGKVAHVFSQIGNIAGDILAPATMANIPGTQLNMQEREGDLAKRLNTEISDESQNKERSSAANKNDVDASLEPGKTQSLEDLQAAQTEDAKEQAAERKAAQDNPSLVVGHAHAVNQAIREGRDPATDPLVLQYEKAITSTVPGFNKPTEAPKTISSIRASTGDNKPHEWGFNPKTNAYDIDEGIHYEKPNIVNVNAGEAALDRESKQFGSGHQKSIDAANAQLEKIQDARSMINGSAESQALGIPKVLTALVSGQGSGVRITQAELNQIASARGLTGDVEGTLNSWSGKGKLTSTQQKQLTGILDDVKARLVEKQHIANDALNTINGAKSRDEIVTADREARQKLNDFETHGHYVGQVVTLKNGQQHVITAVHGDGSFD